MPEDKPVGEQQAGQLDQITQLRSIYVNGFGIQLGNCDVSVVLHNNGKPLFLMNLSFTVAKTLAQELTHTINHLEKASGMQIMTAGESAAFLNKAAEETPR